MPNMFALSGSTMEDVEVDKDDQNEENQDDINHTLLGRTTEDVEEEMVD